MSAWTRGIPAGPAGEHAAGKRQDFPRETHLGRVVQVPRLLPPP